MLSLILCFLRQGGRDYRQNLLPGQDGCKAPYQPLMVSLSNHFLLRCVLRQAQDERHSADLPDFAAVLVAGWVWLRGLRVSAILAAIQRRRENCYDQRSCLHQPWLIQLPDVGGVPDVQRCSV